MQKTMKKLRLEKHFSGRSFMERIKGVEPSCSAWEADVLPMNYTRESVVFDIIADRNENCNKNFVRRENFLF